MRRLKLGQLLDTLPERLALARSHDLAHIEFLEQLFCDEVHRRDADSAGLRARAAKLDPHMVLEAWDESAKITYDRAVWSELVSMRFVEPGPQRLHPGTGRGGQDLHGHRPRAHRLPAAHQRALRTGRPTAQATEGGSSRRQLRPRDAQAHRCRPARRSTTSPSSRSTPPRRPTSTSCASSATTPSATVLTSNRDPSEWLAVMADPLLAQSAVDRLKSAAWELVIEGESYRQHEKPTLESGVNGH